RGAAHRRRRLHPRAAPGRWRPPRLRPVGADVPARRPGRRVRPGGVAAGRTARGGPGRGRGPAGTRPGGHGEVRAVINELLRPDLRGRTAYGAPELDVPVRRYNNENPDPPPVAAAPAGAHDAAAYPPRPSRSP